MRGDGGDLLQVQGVAGRLSDDGGRAIRLGSMRVNQQDLLKPGHQERCFLVRKPTQRDDGASIQRQRSGHSLPELGTALEDQDQRHGGDRLDQLLERLEQRVASPMQVVQDHHGRAVGGDGLQEPADGPQDLAPGGSARAAGTDQRRQLGLDQPGFFGGVSGFELPLKQGGRGLM